MQNSNDLENIQGNDEENENNEYIEKNYQEKMKIQKVSAERETHLH